MTIPGYILIAPICDIGDLVLHRAIRVLDDQSVLLTGMLSFAAGDPMELINYHIARQPVSPDLWNDYIGLGLNVRGCQNGQ